ncbi:MAG: helix-turn-helix transcriptional regulator [Lachnospiraceae bacterium]|nr:helix-turn-helix transcriptional regulator [Lachnospiraceae bacterium]
MANQNISAFSSEDIKFDHVHCSYAEYDFPSHSHDVCELLFLIKGDIHYMVEGKVYHLPQHSLVISRASALHSIKSNAPTEYERFNILFDEKKIGNHFFEKIPQDIDVVNFYGNELVCSLFRKFDYYSENFKQDALKKLLMNLTEEILCNVLLSSQDAVQSNSNSSNPIVNQALHYIHKNITQPLTIESLCQELYITKSHLHHLFINHLEITPKKYILSRKLLLARRELRSGSKPTDVCVNYGFCDYSTFYRHYVQYFGHTPSQEIHTKIDREIIS